ncbi:hypothetical protein [Veillonella caviae]|uniref:hypothetical protein n=2 Tax=Veillonella caviae TaxID=248316 RepID=UPI0023F7114C|nr:hypothetical protein [Veillonella caviae]MCF0157922.1 hypothetical protein [Veillonella sp.]
MDILNDILSKLLAGVSHEHIVDMGVVVILTTALLFVDASQRVAIEVLRYNKDNNRCNTISNCILTLIWYGWGRGKYLDPATGKSRRYLMSERLRSDLLTKLCVQYPAWMILSVVFISLPDIPIPSTEMYLDHVFAVLFMAIPFLSECWSIIENLREIVEDNLIDFGMIYLRIIEIIKVWRGHG